VPTIGARDRRRERETATGESTDENVRLAFGGVLALGVANAQAPPAQPAAQPAQQEVKVVTTKLGGNVYGIDGQGGRAAALVGPDGIFLVDAQFARVTDKIVAALKELSPSPIKFLVNTHVHGDHTGGNENFAKLGATILGRPNVRAQLLNPRPAPVTVRYHRSHRRPRCRWCSSMRRPPCTSMVRPCE